MQSLHVKQLTERAATLESSFSRRGAQRLIQRCLNPRPYRGRPLALSVDATEGHYLEINEHRWLIERALHHSASVIKQQLQQQPALDEDQLRTRLSHQVRMVLRCSVSNIQGERYPYFYQGRGDLLYFGPSAVSIPAFTDWIFEQIGLTSRRLARL